MIEAEDQRRYLVEATQGGSHPRQGDQGSTDKKGGESQADKGVSMFQKRLAFAVAHCYGVSRKVAEDLVRTGPSALLPP